jgi:hypothetical protein
MASKARLTVLESRSRPSDGATGGGRRLREFLKFSLAIAAVGSTAYGVHQAIQQPEPARRSPEVRREEPAKAQRSFFQALIEADRDALKSLSVDAPNARSAAWKGFESFGRGVDPAKTGTAGDASGGSSLRAFFTTGNPAAGQTGPHGGWDLAFVSAGIANRKMQPPAPARPSPPEASAPRPAATAPAPVPQDASHIPAQSAPFRSPSAAVESVRPQAAVTDNAPAPPTAKPVTGFREVHAGQVKATPAVPRDDLDFVTLVLAAAERDFDYLPRAQAVVAEFARRFPQAPEANQFRTRHAAIRGRHAATVTERSTLTADTRVAPVLFEPEAKEAVVACLAPISELQKLSAVTRPVSSAQDRLAFLVAATVAPTGAALRETYLEEMRQKIAAALGACLSPLFGKGTVALSLTDGQDSDLTRQRIDGTEGATIFARGSFAMAAPPGDMKTP